MKASVGRIVHYYHFNPDGRPPGEKPRAAIVVAAFDDGTAVLHVYDHGLGPKVVEGRTGRMPQGDPAEERCLSIWCQPPRVGDGPSQPAAYPNAAPPLVNQAFAGETPPPPPPQPPPSEPLST